MAHFAVEDDDGPNPAAGKTEAADGEETSEESEPAEEPGEWRCDSCQVKAAELAPKLRPLLDQERRSAAALEQIHDNLAAGKLPALSPTDVEAEARKAERALSPTHFLAASLWRELSRVCATLALHWLRQGFLPDMTPVDRATGPFQNTAGAIESPQKLRLASIRAALRYVRACESIAAGTAGSDGSVAEESHPPLFECAQVMLSVGHDLLALPEGQADAAGVGAVRRYLPFIRLWLGSAGDVTELEAFVARDDGEEGPDDDGNAFVWGGGGGSGDDDDDDDDGGGGDDDDNVIMKMLGSDPEIMALMSQPGVGEAMQKIMQGGHDANLQGSLSKCQDDPAVMAAFKKIQSRMMAAMDVPRIPPVPGGMLGGMPGGMS
eukprot:COSAG04_NODE_36_length_34202_cov_16.186904_10_plen_378_part_00